MSDQDGQPGAEKGGSKADGEGLVTEEVAGGGGGSGYEGRYAGSGELAEPPVDPTARVEFAAWPVGRAITWALVARFDYAGQGGKGAHRCAS